MSLFQEKVLPKHKCWTFRSKVDFISCYYNPPQGCLDVYMESLIINKNQTVIFSTIFTLLKTEHSPRKQMLLDVWVIVPYLKVIWYVLTLWKLFLTSCIDLYTFSRDFAVWNWMITLKIYCWLLSQVQNLFPIVGKQPPCIFWYQKFSFNRLWLILIAACIYLSSVLNLFFSLMSWFVNAFLE